MDVVEGIGYVSLGVASLDDSVDFYRKIGHLNVSEKGPGTAFLTGGTQHHWIRLDETRPPGINRLGFQVTDRESLDIVANRLDAKGAKWVEANDLVGDRISDAIRFDGPDGFEIELFTDMVSLPVKTETFLNMDRLLHAVWFVSSPTDSRNFYKEVLGFKESDWIERFMVFMRAANRYHHSVAMMRVPDRAGELDHFCILVDDIDDVLKARNIAIKHGIELRPDLLRHAASGSISTYLKDPITGVVVEFCVWHTQIDDENYRPRVLPVSPVTQDVWQQEPAAEDGRREASSASEPSRE